MTTSSTEGNADGTNIDRWVSEIEASQITGLSRSYFQHDRWKKPPRIPYYKLGSRTVRYRLADLSAFMSAAKVGAA